MVLPPVTAEPAAPPRTAPPAVPTVSPVLPQPAMPSIDANAIPIAMNNLLIFPPVVRKSAAGSVAAAQQEDHEQHRDGHANRPQQDVPQLAFLLPAPLLQLLHMASKPSTDAPDGAIGVPRCGGRGETPDAE